MKDNIMLRRDGLLFLLLFFSLFIQSKGITLVGRVSNPAIKQLYVFSVYDEQNVYLLPLDSIRVVDHDFKYHNDTLKSQLLFITPVSEKKDVEAAFLQGCYIFPSNGMNDFAFSLSVTKGIKVESSSSPFQTLYEQFVKERDRVGQKQLLDSLDQVFYAAREKNDSREMEEIKRTTAPIYNNAYKQLRSWFDTQITAQRGTPFGIYLYYTYKLQHSKLDTKAKVDGAERMLQGFGPDLQDSHYYQLAFRKVLKAKSTLVGEKAPNIVGVDETGRRISLNDFRGKYVLVDFWSSSCKWCRKETPNIRKAYDDFKSKVFVVLGVSTDLHKTEWLKAIETDKATWNHLLLPKEQRSRVLESYNIISIPEILLIDPEGNILAKGLRGERIYETVKMYLK